MYTTSFPLLGPNIPSLVVPTRLKLDKKRWDILMMSRQLSLPSRSSPLLTMPFSSMKNPVGLNFIAIQQLRNVKYSPLAVGQSGNKRTLP